jgi:hypothetical protein
MAGMQSAGGGGFVRRAALGAAWLLGAMVLACQGCTLAGYVATTLERTGSHEVNAEYEGLADKRVAVVLAADKIIQANYPRLVAELSNSIAVRLAAESKIPMKMTPPAVVLKHQLDHPRWAAKAYDELGAALSAERLIIIDLYEFRLNEPGNQWVWSGIAAARVGVVEVDGPVPEEFVYTQDVAVDFPDVEGAGPEQYSAQQISAVLRKRLVDRIIWLFFKHEEKNVMDY